MRRNVIGEDADMKQELDQEEEKVPLERTNDQTGTNSTDSLEKLKAEVL